MVSQDSPAEPSRFPWAATIDFRRLFMTNFLSFRALFNWSRPSDFFLAFVFAPAFDLLFYSFFGRFLSVENEEFYLSGGVTLATCLPALSGGVMSVTSERYYGTLEAFLISPGAFGAAHPSPSTICAVWGRGWVSHPARRRGPSRCKYFGGCAAFFCWHACCVEPYPVLPSACFSVFLLSTCETSSSSSTSLSGSCRWRWVSLFLPLLIRHG